jgi:PelA/Pel-15E family pectate lyase
MHFTGFLKFQFLFAVLALLQPVQAKVIGTNVIAQPVTAERIAQLPRGEQRAWIDYLSRSNRQKQADKQALQQEMAAAHVTVSNPAPAGHSASGLNTSHPAEWYASAEALMIARNVITYQVPDGGWSKNIDMATKPRAPGDRYDTDNMNRFSDPEDFDKPVDEHWHYIATLDNDSTWTQIRFLAHVVAALHTAGRDAEATAMRSSIQRGVEYMLASQYPNGGWPQVWPLEGGYHDAITINDDAMLHAIEVLLDAAAGSSGYETIPSAMRKRAAAAAQHGIACLLQLQITENGHKSAWAQQYDALTLQPTSARNYEMASISSGESASIVNYFMEMKNPTPQIVASVYAAAAWFQKTAVYGYRFGSSDYRADRTSPAGRMLVAAPGAGPIWSRYYQMGTDKPIFGDRDKTIHDDVNELSRERRNGYGWYSGEGVALLAKFKDWAASHPPTN